jgi:hypothetical protein
MGGSDGSELPITNSGYYAMLEHKQLLIPLPVFGETRFLEPRYATLGIAS